MRGHTRSLRPHDLRALGLLLLAAPALLVATAATLTRPTDPNPDALWVAESTGALKLAAGNGATLFEILIPGGVDALAVDPATGKVWTYSHRRADADDDAGKARINKRLRAYTPQGKLSVEVLTPQIKDGSRASLLVDYSRIWLVVDRTLYRFDDQGRLLTTVRLTKKVLATSVDRARSHLWVATDDEIKVFDAMGQTVLSLTSARSQTFRALAYDPYLDETWVATETSLRRYEPAGQQVFERARLAIKADHLAADGQGGLWVASHRGLSHIDRAGSVAFTLASYGDDDDDNKLIDIAADPSNGSVWTIDKRTLKHYAPDGQLLHALKPKLADRHPRKLYGLSLFADMSPPELAMTAPDHNAYLNNARPPITLIYSDEGAGVNTATLAFTVDGEPISASCQEGSEPETVLCTPDTALPEGSLTLAALAQDYAGNVSESAEARFTVDTTPPQITIVAPEEGRITNQTALDVTGEVNEAADLTINAAPVPLDLARRFEYALTLTEGSNRITLTATDFAGNTATESRRVTWIRKRPCPPISD